MKDSIEERLAQLEAENKEMKVKLANVPKQTEPDLMLVWMGKAGQSGKKDGKGFHIRVYEKDEKGHRILLEGSTPEAPKYKFKEAQATVWADKFDALREGRRRSINVALTVYTPPTPTVKSSA